MKRIILLALIGYFSLAYSKDVYVLKVQKTVQYRQKIEPYLVKQYKINDIYVSCDIATIDFLKQYQYRAKQTLKKDRILCKKDIYVQRQDRIIFDFGGIEIERNGQILQETSRYVRIKNTNGKIQQIRKDRN